MQNQNKHFHPSEIDSCTTNTAPPLSESGVEERGRGERGRRWGGGKGFGMTSC